MSTESNATISEVVQRLLPQRDALTAAVTEAILREIPEFAHDARLMTLLEAAASENISAAMHAISLGSRLDLIDAPAAGIEHARILAQREVPITVLLRAYRLGQTRFLEGVFEQTRDIELEHGSGALELVRAVSTYIDRISDQVASAYEQERELWVGSKAALRQHWVNQILTEGTVDVAQAEGAMRYRLSGWHVAVEAWIEGNHDSANVVGFFDRATAMLKRITHVRGEHLSVPTDGFQLRLWLPVTHGFSVDGSELAQALSEAGVPVRMAIGAVRQGVTGFRSSARTAQKVKSMALSAGASAPAVLTHGEVAPIALVIDDPDEVEHFVSQTLKDLALPDLRSDDLRETLLTYLEANRSYHVAASRLHVHRNTVHYRVQQAMDQVGMELSADTLALQLALTICRWRSNGTGQVSER
ncbi:MAG: helix-turn-helix domain-containing protein [Nocardioides sp.]|uniref:PucR family transcriptional regulator n=1 Tax=Nocardioides sp. TaxID=35761 RepID=UPI0023A3D0B4|nr:helix-turn-helix domain-containing protein [Nocardioides sp.]MDE0776999.1 helix-turn-helix domain-containing protein [Nocardioides sp.]